MEKHLGRVNFLVNAAGINRDSLLVRTKTEDMVSQLHTNLLGSMLTCKAAVRTMIQQQGGSIVNVGSIVGLKGNSGQSVYSASKGGLVGFSRALAKEVARKKIRVNVVAPGMILSRLWPPVKKSISLISEAQAVHTRKPRLEHQAIILQNYHAGSAEPWTRTDWAPHPSLLPMEDFQDGGPLRHLLPLWQIWVGDGAGHARISPSSLALLSLHLGAVRGLFLPVFFGGCDLRGAVQCCL
ncbi:3-oxoacyl-[acyl-carrier-protein] reductase isoform X2 [Aotus nancymaae]